MLFPVVTTTINNMVSVTGDVTRFVYDGDGTRVLREDTGGLTANVGAVEVHISGTERTTTTYYFAGGQRIAMREGVTVTYLHGDHLGSASLATDAGGAQMSAMRYTPFGEIRYGDAPTDRRFTGQQEESGIGLYDYGARFYSQSLGRFVSADSIVPGAGNPQMLNRYSYVINNPLRYKDPSGYDPIDDAWEQEFSRIHNEMPSDQDRRDRLFSLIFLGSGPNGSWTDDNWLFYHQYRSELWNGSRLWPKAMKPSLDRFITHLERLASYYAPGEEMFYAQAIGFVWGGVPLGHAIPATLQMAISPGTAWAENTPLFEGTYGWNWRLVDDENPAHHYAGLFYLGFFNSGLLGDLGNWMRDGPINFDPRQWGSGICTSPAQEDLDLGYLAVDHAVSLFHGSIGINEVGSVARGALQPLDYCLSCDLINFDPNDPYWLYQYRP